MLIGDILYNNVSRYPNKLALVDGSTRMNWRELNQRVNKVCNMLHGLGIEKGDRVGIIAENCHQYVELLFASAKIGAMTVCLNYRFSPEQLANMINIAEPKILIVQDEYKNLAETVLPKTLSLKKIIGLGIEHGYKDDFEELVHKSSDSEPSVELSDEDGYVICFSSGTTGVPKAAFITHRNRITNCIQVCLVHEVRRDSVFMISMALYAAVSHQWLLTYAFAGATIVMINFTAEGYLEAIEREKVNTILINHTFYIMLEDYLKTSGRVFDVSSIKLIQSAGQALSYEQWQKVLKFFNYPILSKGLAMTEAGNATFGIPEEYRDWLLPDASEEDKRKFNSLGKPMLGTQIKIVNENDEKLPFGEVGEIVVKGDNVVKRFWNQPDATENVLRGGWLHTGDLGMIDEDGYMYLMGRRDERIRTGGYNVYPIEIERVMALHPAVVEPAVLGVDDERWGEMIVAAVILKDGAQITEEELKNHCRQHIAGFQVPKRIFFLQEFPRHPVWKRVVKKDLAQEISERLALKSA